MEDMQCTVLESGGSQSRTAATDAQRNVESADSESVTREMLVFCAQYRDDKTDMQGEGQKIKRIIDELQRNSFRCNYNPWRPTLQDSAKATAKGGWKCCWSSFHWTWRQGWRFVCCF